MGVKQYFKLTKLGYENQKMSKDNYAEDRAEEILFLSALGQKVQLN